MEIEAALALAEAGQRAGLGARDLIKLLDSGMSLEQLLEYLRAKLCDMPVEN